MQKKLISTIWIANIDNHKKISSFLIFEGEIHKKHMNNENAFLHIFFIKFFTKLREVKAPCKKHNKPELTSKKWNHFTRKGTLFIPKNP